MSLSTKAWRRLLLSVLAAAVLLLPAVSQAAPRPAVSALSAGAHAGPAQWLARMWHGLTGLWQTVTGAADTGQGGAAGSSTTGDAGASIDPDGHHG
jgi:hypothetical protein